MPIPSIKKTPGFLVIFRHPKEIFQMGQRVQYHF